MKAVLFDLDNTLYPEMEFVCGGLRAAAEQLSQRTGVAAQRLFERAKAIMDRDGRGRVFDALLSELDVEPQEAVTKMMVLAYRTHRPAIGLFDDVLPAFSALRRLGLRLGLVTDGMGSIQRRKIEALRLDRLLDVVVCTDELGREFWKPSTVPFCVALESLSVRPQDAAYVGDDPAKDFVGPNALGMWTIRILRPGLPQGRSSACGDGADPKHTIPSLDGLPRLVIETSP
jgi:putative hydrolase of the HAD superfamily